MNTEDKDVLFNRALQLTGASDARFLELARTLHALKLADEDSFAQYISFLKRGRRKAYYLLQIGQAFSDLKVSDADLQEIGWTKLLRLAPVVNKANLDELVATAKIMTHRELAASLKGQKMLKARHAMTLFMTPTQRALLAKHLRRNGATQSGRGLQGKEDALVRLLERYEQLLEGAKASGAAATK